jgi:hypothetical protein
MLGARHVWRDGCRGGIEEILYKLMGRDKLWETTAGYLRYSLK